jgi:hypothetical protein
VTDVNAVHPKRNGRDFVTIDQHVAVLFELDDVIVESDRHRLGARRHARHHRRREIHGLRRQQKSQMSLKLRFQGGRTTFPWL